MQNNSLSSEPLHQRTLEPSRIIFKRHADVIVGGYGDVHQARYRVKEGDERRVAVKKLRPQGDWFQRIRVIAVCTSLLFLRDAGLLTIQQALVRELRVWGNLDHPNILRLLGFHFDVEQLESAWIVTMWQKSGNIVNFLATKKLNETTRLKLVSLDLHFFCPESHFCASGFGHRKGSRIPA